MAIRPRCYNYLALVISARGRIPLLRDNGQTAQLNKQFIDFKQQLSCPRRSMDRTLACEAGNAGSIPAGGTKNNSNLLGLFFWLQKGIERSAYMIFRRINSA